MIIECFVPAASYFPLHMSIIAATAFHFRVRNENGCFHSAKPPEQKIQFIVKTSAFTYLSR